MIVKVCKGDGFDVWGGITGQIRTGVFAPDSPRVRGDDGSQHIYELSTRAGDGPWPVKWISFHNAAGEHVWIETEGAAFLCNDNGKTVERL
jgi:hypothetical protein